MELFVVQLETETEREKRVKQLKVNLQRTGVRRTEGGEKSQTELL